MIDHADRVEQAAPAQVSARVDERRGDADRDDQRRRPSCARGSRGDDPASAARSAAGRRPLERAQHEPQRGERDREADAVLDELDREIRRAGAGRRERRGDEPGAATAAEPRADARTRAARSSAPPIAAPSFAPVIGSVAAANGAMNQNASGDAGYAGAVREQRAELRPDRSSRRCRSETASRRAAASAARTTTRRAATSAARDRDGDQPGRCAQRARAIAQLTGTMRAMPRAVVLLSGGLDSSTALAIARSRRLRVPRADREVRPAPRGRARSRAARRGRARCDEHRVVEVDLAPLAASALTTHGRRGAQGSLARRDRRAGRRAGDVCPRAQHGAARARARVGRVARRARPVPRRQRARRQRLSRLSPGVRPPRSRRSRRSRRARGGFHVHAPLIELTKAEIIQLGTRLGIDYAITHSCYDPDRRCRVRPLRCLCLLRRKGFAEAGRPRSDALRV